MPATNVPRPGRSGQLPDYYAMLGVAEDATGREIEAAYWKRAFDKESRGDLAGRNEAYEALSSTVRREAYDRERRNQPTRKSNRAQTPTTRKSTSPGRLLG